MSATDSLEEDDLLHWVGYTLIQAGIEEKILGPFVVSALEEGFQTNEKKLESSTVEELTELLASASPEDSEDIENVSKNICTTYEKYRGGQPLPDVPRSRHQFVNTSDEPEEMPRSWSLSSSKSENSQAQPTLSAAAYEFVPGIATLQPPPPQKQQQNQNQQTLRSAAQGVNPYSYPESYDSGVASMSPYSVEGTTPSTSTSVPFEYYPSAQQGDFQQYQNSQAPLSSSFVQQHTPPQGGMAYAMDGSYVPVAADGPNAYGTVNGMMGEDVDAYMLQQQFGSMTMTGSDTIAYGPNGEVINPYSMGVPEAAAPDPDLQRQLRTLLRSMEDALDDHEFDELVQLGDAQLEDALLMFLDRESTDKPDTQVAPCKYYIMGKCFRSDCWYSHDLKQIPCKHLAAGWCHNGDSCQFGHDDRVLVRTAAAALRSGYRAMHLNADESGLEDSANVEDSSVASAEPPDLTEQSFPSLNPAATETAKASAKKSNNTTSTNATKDSQWVKSTDALDLDLASKLKLQKLKEMFPVVWEEDIVRNLLASTGDMSRTVESLKLEFPAAYVPPKETASTTTTSVAASLLPKSSSVSKQNRACVIDWVETGVQLGSDYAGLRSEAIQNATARNRLLQEATAAFMRGDKATARELSREGRYYDQLMRQQHREAAQLLFASRNRGMHDTIDLHGLHVQEALAFLEVYLHRATQEYSRCFVITGTGHHSSHKHIQKDKQARLAPAVQQYLKDNSYLFRDASAKHGGRGGMFEVTLT